jgi:hypothetical protein
MRSARVPAFAVMRAGLVWSRPPPGWKMSAENTTDGSCVHHGGCHCGALRWEFVSHMAVKSLSPRACDCDFCTRHRAAWVSDPEGQLGIRGNRAMLRCLRQGSEQAEFLLCRHCGVLVAVIARANDGRMIGAVNRSAFDARDEFVDETIVSPRLLAADAKQARWGQLWTPTDLSIR